MVCHEVEMTRSRTLVTGATGAVGGAVLRFLSDHGARRVTALVRRPHAVAGLADGVDHRLADYHDADALRAALSGVQTLVLVSSDGPSERVLEQSRR